MKDYSLANPDHSDPYVFHRLALLPLYDSTANGLELHKVSKLGLADFFEGITMQGLGQLWRQYLEPLDLPTECYPWLENQRQHARLTAAHQMLQGNEIRVFDGLARDLKIPYFLFKGADLRNSIYAEPTMRPVSDIDLFIHKIDKTKVISLFTELGYQLHVRPENESHEISLIKGNICFDIHWELMRPGRCRKSLAQWLFEHCSDNSGITGLDTTASALVMLIHPAITKYLLSPTSMLIHQVDLAKIFQSEHVDWDELEQTLNWSGMKTAAWSSLYVLEKLTGIKAPDDFSKRIEPGRLHAWYLRQWIDRAWITKWFEHRWLVAGFFSLALQDSPRDAFRAILNRGQVQIVQ